MSGTRANRLLLALIVSGMSAHAAAAQAIPQSRSMLKGTVVDDADERPVPGATVAIEVLRLSTVTDSAGAFRLSSVPFGRYVVSVKRIGYGNLTAVVTFGAGDSLDYDFALVKQATALPEVAVTTKAPVRPKLAEFEERRAAGFGRFLPESIFIKNEHRRMSEVVQTLSGTRIMRGWGGNGWVASSVGYSSEGKFRPSNADINRGADPNQCYAAILLDGNPIFTGQPGELLFDVNSLGTNTIAGVEWYRDAATVPQKFNFSRGATCGLLVIWTK
jgi:hypothetical protein